MNSSSDLQDGNDKPGTLNRLFLLLLLVVVLPVLVYSVYEFTTVSADEELMASVYRRQLDVILFSLNQYSWDVINSWAGSINMILDERSTQPADSLRHALEDFLSKKSSVRAILLSDTGLSVNRTYRSPSRPPADRGSDSAIEASVTADHEGVRHLLGYLRADYRKIDPVRLGARGTQEQHLALRFIANAGGGPKSVVTVILNEQLFVSELLAPRLRDAAGDEFILAVLRGDSTVFTTSSVTPGELRDRKDLWLLPSWSLGIRPRGTTIDELAEARSRRNIVLIVFLDCVLLVGAFLVYRNLRGEVELVRMKAGFVSNVSHELRTPLSLIRMYAETLEMGRIGTDEKRKQYYTTILRESERLTRLVNNVLSFAKLDAGKKQYHLRPVDINEVVRHVTEMFRVQLQSEGFVPGIDCAADLPPVTADPEAVSEALINLIDNAIKYSPAEKYLRIRTGSEGRQAFIAVEDHGIGITHSHREKIFEQFYRVSDGLVHDVKGSGLGLALVRAIVEAHRGSVRVESTPGKGSTFTMFLPLAVTQPASEGSHQKP